MSTRSCAANGAAVSGSEPARRGERAPADRCEACRVELRRARARLDSSLRSRTAGSLERPCHTGQKKTRGVTSVSDAPPRRSRFRPRRLHHRSAPSRASAIPRRPDLGIVGPSDVGTFNGPNQSAVGPNARRLVASAPISLVAVEMAAGCSAPVVEGLVLDPLDLGIEREHQASFGGR